MVASVARMSAAYSSGWPSRDHTVCTQPRAPLAKWNRSVIASSMFPRGPSAWASRTEPAVVWTAAMSPAIAR